MSLNNEHPEGHPFSISDIMKYLENEMDESQTTIFEQHLKECIICKRTAINLAEQDLFHELTAYAREGHLKANKIESYLNKNLSEKEERHIENHIARCMDCKRVFELYKTKVDKTTSPVIDEIFSSLDMAKEYAVRVYKEIEPEGNIKHLNEAWHSFFEESFDWDKGKYRQKKEEIIPKITEGAFTFELPTRVEPLFVTLIKIIAEIRSWIIQKSKRGVKLKRANLRKYLIKKGFKEQFIKNFFKIIRNINK